MGKKGISTQPKPLAESDDLDAAQPQTGAPVFVRLAYLDGPPDIFFAGRRWLRGVAQPVTLATLEGMQTRRDFAAYRFTEQAPA